MLKTFKNHLYGSWLVENEFFKKTAIIHKNQSFFKPQTPNFNVVIWGLLLKALAFPTCHQHWSRGCWRISSLIALTPRGMSWFSDAGKILRSCEPPSLTCITSVNFLGHQFYHWSALVKPYSDHDHPIIALEWSLGDHEELSTQWTPPVNLRDHRRASHNNGGQDLGHLHHCHGARILGWLTWNGRNQVISMGLKWVRFNGIVIINYPSSYY